MRTIRMTRILALALVLTGAACSSESLGPSTGGTGSLSVVPSSATIGRGQAIQLTATLFDEFGDPLQTSVTWSSSNPSVATVSVGGTVFGREPGRAAITATTHGKTHGSAVHVVDGEPQSKPKPQL